MRKHMSVGILYERSEIDEMGIRLTAEELGITLRYIPFRKIAVKLNKDGYCFRSRGRDYCKTIEDVSVVLNRAQSKNRRLAAAQLFETFDKYVINPFGVEYICHSKLRTALHLWKVGITIPQTVYIPCDSYDKGENCRMVQNHEEIADLIRLEFGDAEVVIKPDAGTHGRDIKLARNRSDLIKILNETKPSIVNPLGILSQRCIQKWFYDLRIIVTKERGVRPFCYPTAMARTGLKDFKTNASLGNMVFGVKMTKSVRDAAVKCASAIGKNRPAWVLALDAMIDFSKDNTWDDEEIESNFKKLEQSFSLLKTMKQDYGWSKDFEGWNSRLEENFQSYKCQDEYWRVKDIIEASIQKNEDNLLFHEVNACPEFWERTRLATGLNVAIPLLQGAQSIIDGAFEA